MGERCGEGYGEGCGRRMKRDERSTRAAEAKQRLQLLLIVSICLVEILCCFFARHVDMQSKGGQDTLSVGHLRGCIGGG